MLKYLACTTLAILLLATPVAAQQTSVTYEPLVGSTQLLNRVTFNIVLALQTIQTEAQAYTPPSGDTHPASNACHSLRVSLAAAAARNPASYASIFATHLASNSAVTTAGVLTGSLPATLDTPATDAELFSAINAIWSTVAGCVTTP